MTYQDAYAQLTALINNTPRLPLTFTQIQTCMNTIRAAVNIATAVEQESDGDDNTDRD